MEDKVLGTYVNGNFTVTIFESGTKIRENDLDCLIPDMPESVDMKITNKCERKCKYCHEMSTPEGKHADLRVLEPLINSMNPWSEIAIGGGNPIVHPDLHWFLGKLKERNIIANMTVNYRDLQERRLQKRFLKDLIHDDLIKGVGISAPDPANEEVNWIEFVNVCNEFPHTVVHVINRIHSGEAIDELMKYGDELKVLILGYKTKGRGCDFVPPYADDVMSDKFFQMGSAFEVLCFDNLALEQLNVKDKLSQITDVAQNTSASSEEAAAAAQELTSQSDMMHSLASVFNIKE